MAPEFPPTLVIFSSRIEDGVLKGTVEYVEAARSDHPLRVRWSAETRPDDYRAVGDGVAFVYDSASTVQVFPRSVDASPSPLGNDRYVWTEGLRTDRPWLMFVLVLPRGYTLTDPRPLPVGTKIFDGRLALYWTLRGGGREQARVQWTMKKLDGDIESELLRLNGEYLSQDPPMPATIRVEDARESRAVKARPAVGAAEHDQRRTKVFVSYSQKDRRWLEMLQTHLSPVVRSTEMEVWDDTKLRTGEQWRRAIREAIDSARAAVLLVSPDFMASTFIANDELPPLLTAARDEGVTILPVIIRESFLGTLAEFQAVNSPSKPLIKMSTANRDRIWIKLVADIRSAMGN